VTLDQGALQLGKIIYERSKSVAEANFELYNDLQQIKMDGFKADLVCLRLPTIGVRVDA
jgi:hypothetical protein